MAHGRDKEGVDTMSDRETVLDSERSHGRPDASLVLSVSIALCVMCAECRVWAYPNPGTVFYEQTFNKNTGEPTGDADKYEYTGDWESELLDIKYRWGFQRRPPDGSWTSIYLARDGSCWVKTWMWGTWTRKLSGSNFSPAGSREESDTSYSSIWDGSQGPVHPELKPDGTYAFTEEPINVINGAMVHTHTDVVIPAPGLSLVLRRNYNSQLNYSGPLGPQWIHTLDWQLFSTNAVEGDSTNAYRVVRTGTGESLWFMEYATNTFSSPYGLTWRLEMDTNGTYQAIAPEGTSYAFDTNGVLTEIWEPAGNTSYTNSFPTQLLVAATHDNGQSLEFGYESNLLVSVTTPTNALGMAFAYNALGELTNAARTVGASTQTAYYAYAPATNGYHCLTQIVNAAGHEFDYGYATNASAGESPPGVSMALNDWYYSHTVDYGTSNDWETTVTYDRGDTNQVFEYHFNAALQRVDRITGPDGTNTVLVREVDGQGHEIAVTRTNVLTGDFYKEIFARDEWHNVVTSGVALGVTPTNLWTFAWNTNPLTLALSIDPEGAKTEFEYTNGLVACVKFYRTTNTTYDTTFGYTTNGLLAAVTNANGHWVRYGYDQYGFPTSSVPQAGPAPAFRFSRLGHLETLTQPGDTPRTTTFRNDALGHVTNIVHADGLGETFLFDPLGNLTNHVDRAGRTNTFTYAPARKLTSATRILAGTSNQNVTVSFAYDKQFNTLSITDALGRAVETYILDIQDRAEAVTNLEQQTMEVTYGIGGFVDAVERFDGTEVTFDYEHGGNLSDAAFPDATNTFTYLKNGLLRTATSETGSVTNSYNMLNRLAATTGVAPSSTVTYAYYPAGQVSNVVSIAGTNAYSIDGAARVTGIDAPAGLFSYTYNTNNGLVAEVTYTNGTGAEFLYDVTDRLTNIVWRDSSDAVVRSFAYRYSSADMITNVTFAGGEERRYQYDTLDRLTREKHVNASDETVRNNTYGYDLVGNRTSKETGNGTVTHTLGDGNRLSAWSLAGSGLTAPIEVGGNSTETIGTNQWFGELWVSNVAAVTPAVQGTNFTAFSVPVTVGSTQQLVAAVGDAAGNVGYATNALLVTAVTNAAYGHSSAGCVTSIVYKGDGYTNSTALTWDSQYRLIGVSIDGTNAENYAYDALGRRISIASGSATNHLVWTGPHVIAEVDEDGELLKSYVWGPGIDNPLAYTTYSATETNTYYMLTDHLGTVHAVTDEDGEIVESYRYDAWGRVLGVYDEDGAPLDESAIGNHYLWQGRWYSWKTGLYYFRARWYDPVAGRWLSKDPIGISGGLNQYVAFGNNPVGKRDPLGLCDGEPQGNPGRYRNGEEFVEQYIADLREASRTVSFWWPSRMYDWSISGGRDLAFERRGEEYAWRGYVLQADQMGNAGPGYAFTTLYGPEVAAAVCVGAEAWDSVDPRSRGKDWIDNATGSFSANAIGIDEALRDQGEGGLVERILNYIIITGVR